MSALSSVDLPAFVYPARATLGEVGPLALGPDDVVVAAHVDQAPLDAETRCGPGAVGVLDLGLLGPACRPAPSMRC